MSEDSHLPPTPHILSDINRTVSSTSTTTSLKRRASPSFECPDEGSRKKMKEELLDKVHQAGMTSDESSSVFVDELVQELQCGCCSELVYKPVIVLPCQHFFCGSCCVLWIRNGGTNCPACRGVSTIAMPFRAIQPLIDIILRKAPDRARTQRERDQADEVYKSGLSIRIPPPREASPPPDMNRSTEFVHPCPHCLPNNPYDWRCPQPIPDPTTDIDHAWPIDDGLPPGHGNCGNCENLLALSAPTTTKCDFCLVSFCGIGVQDRCMTLPLLSQHPHNMSSHADLIQSAELYESFDNNTVEVDFMLEYLETQGITPRHIYRDIIHQIQKQPRGFAPLIESDLFTDIHSVAPGPDVDINSPRSKICRLCAGEIFLWGLKDWWVRERQKGFLEPHIMSRKDCPVGRDCARQKDDLAHAKEFNHIFPNSDDEGSTHGAVDTSVSSEPAQQAPPTTTGEGTQQERNIRSPDSSSPSTSNPNIPGVASSSSASLSFLLDLDQDVEMSSSPPQPPSSSAPNTPAIH